MPVRRLFDKLTCWCLNYLNIRVQTSAPTFSFELILSYSNIGIQKSAPIKHRWQYLNVRTPMFELHILSNSNIGIQKSTAEIWTRQCLNTFRCMNRTFIHLSAFKSWPPKYELADVWTFSSKIGRKGVQTSAAISAAEARRGKCFQVADAPTNRYDYTLPVKTSLKKCAGSECPQFKPW